MITRVILISLMRLTMRIGQLVSVVYIAYAIYIVHTPHIMHWTRMVRNKKNSYDTHATKVSLKFVCEAKQNNCYSVIFGSSNMSLFCLYVIYIPFIRVCVCVCVCAGMVRLNENIEDLTYIIELLCSSYRWWDEFFYSDWTI